MSIESRKLEFVQSFLLLEDEDFISRFELLLEEIKSENSPFTKDELDKRISTSERDFENGNYKSTQQLLEKY